MATSTSSDTDTSKLGDSTSDSADGTSAVSNLDSKAKNSASEALKKAEATLDKSSSTSAGGGRDGDTVTVINQEPPKKSWISRFFRRLFQLIIALAIIGGLAAAALVAWPEFDERVLQRVDANSEETAAVQTNLEGSNARITELETQAETLRTDLDTVTADVSELDTLTSEQTSRLDQLDELSLTLDSQLTDQSAEVAVQVDMLRSMELLSRARLFLYQSNFGLAREDVAMARSVLAGIDPADGDATVAPTIERLDSVLAALPSFPVLASDDLDIAWATLLGDVPPLDAVGEDGEPVAEDAADAAATDEAPAEDAGDDATTTTTASNEG